MNSPKNQYLEVVYNPEDRPFTAYPDQLARYLADRYGMQSHHRLLEPGCGRGEFLRGFLRCGLQGFGVDQSDIARTLCPEAEIRVADLEKGLPYEDGFFDFIYSKSVIEHFYYPENLVREMFRALKPGGLLITLTPDWEYVYQSFYEDYTHRTPFTSTSLRDILLIHGFQEVSVEKFRQLPIVWKYPLMKYVSILTGWICPRALEKHSKFIRFSKQIMLLATARKPKF